MSGIQVGDLLGEWTYQVEAGKVLEFARAVRDEHAGRSDFAPPTFPMVISADFTETLVTEILGLDRTRTVHGEQSYDYDAPIKIGDTLICRARLIGDIVKAGRRGGQMRFVTTEIEYLSVATGKRVCRETCVSVEKSVVQ